MLVPAGVVGDLSDLEETRGVASQVNRLGRMDAVIHNAGVNTGPNVLPVNVVAPYLLTVLIHRPRRLVYLSSSMHRGGRVPSLGSGRKCSATRWTRAGCRRRWAAPVRPRTSGGYWYHQRRAEPAPSVHDQRFQDHLLEDLARLTATPMTQHKPKENSCVEQ